MNKTLLKVENLKKYYVVKKSFDKKKEKVLKAVDDVSFEVNQSEILGLVGESGCGKSTLGRSVLKLNSIDSGNIIFEGENIEGYKKEKMRLERKKMQMIFQDPYSSLNPRMTVYESVKSPLDVFKIGTEHEKKEKVIEMLNVVGLGEQHINKYPHEMSGGQRQRVVIARAMILNPSFVVCDEPVSALDVSVRSQVLNLMKEIQEKTKVAFLFISHDLSVVKYLCDRIMVMYLGQIVEEGSKQELFDNPIHPYTKALLSAIPIPDVDVKMKKIPLIGDIPSPINPPKGCRFNPRCAYAKEECRKEEPKLKCVNGTHKVSCIRVNELNS